MKWEYMTKYGVDEKFYAMVDGLTIGRTAQGIISTLNKLGQDGWELVSILPLSQNVAIYYLKRVVELER